MATGLASLSLLCRDGMVYFDACLVLGNTVMDTQPKLRYLGALVLTSRHLQVCFRV